MANQEQVEILKQGTHSLARHAGQVCHGRSAVECREEPGRSLMAGHFILTSL
jgi:hypothetical protein